MGCRYNNQQNHHLDSGQADQPEEGNVILTIEWSLVNGGMDRGSRAELLKLHWLSSGYEKLPCAHT